MKKVVNNSHRSWLRQRLYDLDIRHTNFMLEMGLRPQHLDWLEGKPRRDISFLYKMADKLKCDRQKFLLFWDNKISEKEVWAQRETVNIEMLDVSACCGNGTEVDKEPVIGFWQMPTSDYNSMSLTTPENIKIIRAIGDSMQPTISDGDFIFVDISNKYIISDGVYVLRLPTGLSIKRIQSGLTGDVTVRSDNPAYEPITAKLGDVQVLGRVVKILNVKKI